MAEQDHVICGGDFNVIFDPKLDRKGGRALQSKAGSVIGTFLEEYDWCDIWRQMNPGKFKFTWKGLKPLIMSRLDYFIAPINILSSVSSIEILNSTVSDHNPVVMILESQLNLRGPGYWKLNVDHLKNKVFIDEVNEAIDIAKKNYANCNPSNRWEKIKESMRQTMYDLSKRTASEKNKKVRKLRHQFNMLHKKLNMINLKAENAIRLIEQVNIKIDAIQTELQKIEKSDAQGAILRAKARWISEAEHNSKYFFALEKRNAKNKVISALREKNGSITKNQGKIIDLQSSFYKELYTAEENFTCNIEEGIEHKTIGAELRKELDVELELSEVQEAIKKMARRKSPGISGFSVDVYIVFWGKIKEVFMEAMIFARQEKILHNSARQGLISLIPKKDRDLLEIKNFRPIILLNTDFKIIAKVLANRLKKTLSMIINEDQSAFIRGRQISDTLRKVLDVVEHYEETNQSGVLISIDFMKAFDKVEYSAMYKILEWFGYRENLIGWIKLLFTDFRLSTINNGYISEEFQATKGLFQGNPIAPYLFIIVIELLAIKLRGHAGIKGLKVGEQEILLTLFADDLGLFLEPDQRNWNNAFQVLESFQRQTGMRINYDKTSVYRLGAARSANAKFFSMRKLHWSDEPLTMLGVVISRNRTELIQLNFEPIFKKIESILNMWRQRDLSLFGRVLMINTLAMSLLTYKLAVLPPIPERYVKRYDKMVMDFIWKGGKAKIRKEIIYGSKEDGGAGLFDLKMKDIAMKSQWVRKSNELELFKSLRDQALGVELGNFIWEVSLKEKDYDIIFTKRNFWTDFLKAWNRINRVNDQKREEVGKTFLWFNSNIRIQGHPIWYSNWVENGIYTVNDLRIDDSFMTFEQFIEKYGVRENCLTFLGVINAIPREWKQKLLEVNDNFEDSKTLYELVVGCEKSAKICYSKLVTNENLLYEKCKKFEITIGNVINLEEYINCIKRIKFFTINVKLRSFQYRPLLGGLITNIQLKRYQISESELCSFCNAQRETINHLFCECSIVMPVKNYVKEKLSLAELTDAQILMNEAVRNPKHMENSIVLLYKYFLYKSRCLKEIPHIESFKNFISLSISIEEQIAKNRDKLTLHLLKWSNYQM